MPDPATSATERAQSADPQLVICPGCGIDRRPEGCINPVCPDYAREEAARWATTS